VQLFNAIQDVYLSPEVTIAWCCEGWTLISRKS
jgi:hypothetical protein